MIEQMEAFRVAPMDRTNKVATTALLVVIVATVLVLVALLSGVFDGGEAHGSAGLALLIIAAAVALVLALLVCVYRPSRLEVSHLGVRIAWPLRSRLIRPEDIESVERADRDRTGRVYRAFGMGGLFGTFGLCRSKQLGFVDTYVTRRTGAVLISRREGRGRPLLITPDRPDDFIAAVRAILIAPGN